VIAMGLDVENCANLLARNIPDSLYHHHADPRTSAGIDDDHAFIGLHAIVWLNFLCFSLPA